MQMEEGETGYKTNEFGRVGGTEMCDKYSVSKHHISFCLPRETLLIPTSARPLSKSEETGGVKGSEEERRGVLTQQLSENLIRQ